MHLAAAVAMPFGDLCVLGILAVSMSVIGDRSQNVLVHCMAFADHDLTSHANHRICKVECEPPYKHLKYIVYFSGGCVAYLPHPMRLVANSGGCYEDHW